MQLIHAAIQVNMSETSRSELIAYIYNAPGIRGNLNKFILTHGGTAEEANTLFNETIVQFIKTAFGMREYSHLTGDLEPYLFGIARNLWYAEVKRRGKQNSLIQDLGNEEKLDPCPEELYLTKERNSLFASLLSQLRSNCRAVLMHWANGFSMIEIAEKLGYQSEGMARKKKSQCLAELNDFLFQNPHIKLQLQ